MSYFKTSLIEEKAQVDQKIESLNSFLNSDKIDSVSTDHQYLLSLQLLSLLQYSNVLEMRLHLLEKGV